MRRLDEYDNETREDFAPYVPAETRFLVRLKGSMHSFGLYDSKGREVHTLSRAIEVAEEQFGDEWTEVYNGEDGANREDDD